MKAICKFGENMDVEDLLNKLETIVETLAKTASTLENWYDEHRERKQQRRDEYLTSFTDEELRYFKKDYEIHPERYDLVSKASIKASRKSQ